MLSWFLLSFFKSERLKIFLLFRTNTSSSSEDLVNYPLPPTYSTAVLLISFLSLLLALVNELDLQFAFDTAAHVYFFGQFLFSSWYLFVCMPLKQCCSPSSYLWPTGYSKIILPPFQSLSVFCLCLSLHVHFRFLVLVSEFYSVAGWTFIIATHFPN